MNRVDKIGHITVYKISYGSPLQALATQLVFRKFGLTLELIRYEEQFTKAELIKLKLKHIQEDPSLFYRKLREKMQSVECRLRYPEVQDGRARREKAFEDFNNQYLSFTRLIHTKQERLEIIKNYKVVLSGSDQLWNPANYDDGYFNCRIVPDNIKRISYASSFGTEVIPERQCEGTAAALKKFSGISMRESSGAEIVRQLTGRSVPVVLDPTWLLTAEEWGGVMPQKPLIEGNYILAYFLCENQGMRRKVKELSSKAELKIVTLPHMLKFVKADVGFADEELYYCTPGEWMNIIRNATYVCTDSFHGTVFSVIHNKKFLTMCAYKDGDKRSTNTRIYEILNKLGLRDRLLKLDEDIMKIEDDIDYRNSMERLNQYRQASFDYIEHILEE